MRCGAPRAWVALALGFFGLLPVFPMLAISCTKDVPYYAATLAQLAMIYAGLRGKRRRFYWPRLILVTAYAALMRANALPFMFLLAPLCLLLWRDRAARRRFIAALTAGVALAWGVNALLVAINHAERPLLLLAALLVGPCCILRYALLFMLLATIMIGMLLCSSLSE